MKKIKYILIASLMMLGSFSCNENEWLKEEPLSFYTTVNSYTTVSQFRQALNYLYNRLRSVYWNIGDQTDILNFADLAHGGTDMEPVPTKFNNAQTWLVPTNYVVESYWNIAYLSIGNANTIINRIQSSALSDADKAGIEGEALFFRAYWFNFLANLYGGVPVPTEETTAPRTDYVTTPRAGVYGQARTDLERAVTLLSDITATDDGKISIQAAQHLLAEVYISCGEYDKAIAAASAVINHPSMGLMTSRFGSATDKPGDPYWDLFQYNNQNRSTGNREAILVLQYDYKNSGSGISCQMPRNAFPYIQGLQVARTGGGVVAPILSISNSTPENLGGRGIGVFHPTDYFLYDIWGADGTSDYRNSPYIILRDIRIDNPAAAGYGKWLVADGYLEERFKLRNFYPILLKFARTYDLPDDCYVKNADGSFATNAFGEKQVAYAYGSLSSNCSLKDEYLFRLAGTYLLRAEAYIKNSQPDLALADINALRSRANATPAQLSDINLDYLMDEQMRELYFEDFRTVTLMRMGKFVDRTRTCNPKIGDYVGDHQNLYPIPFSEIERNALGKIDQNPGYN
ncbi:MAG: RagB/SusD family nutrient uptake outer membrane protein [Prevotellaceae bacterium]|jgi:hypothetical protein|nr:RagB/SusD family nutrient uptake outer membrane protein [Prevotellaceae bacterium]